MKINIKPVAYLLEGVGGPDFLSKNLDIAESYCASPAYANAVEPLYPESLVIELAEALAWSVQFDRKEGEDSNEQFERIAEIFRKETGYLRPGKDCMMYSYETRIAAWDGWIAAGRKRMSTALAKVSGGSAT